MAIKKPNEMDFSQKKFTMIISGTPGQGKTSLALSAPKPFLFDTDDGISRVKAEHRCETSTVSTYEELLEDMKSQEFAQAETIVIDTGGTLIQLMKPWAKKQDKRAATNGMAMFGVIKQEFDRLCHEIRSIYKKNLIVVFHTTEVMKNEIVTTRLSCEGSAKDIVWTPADFGGHMFMQGGKRYIGFTPCEEYFAKGCFGVTGVWEVPDLANSKNDFLQKVFEKAHAQIEADGEVFRAEKVKYDKAIADGNNEIDKIKDAKTANKAIEALKEYEHGLTSKKELGALFNAKIKTLNIKKEGDVYVDAKQEPEPKENAETNTEPAK